MKELIILRIEKLGYNCQASLWAKKAYCEWQRKGAAIHQAC
jgi:hypothetical protein